MSSSPVQVHSSWGNQQPGGGKDLWNRWISSLDWHTKWM